MKRNLKIHDIINLLSLLPLLLAILFLAEATQSSLISTASSVLVTDRFVYLPVVMNAAINQAPTSTPTPTPTSTSTPTLTSTSTPIPTPTPSPTSTATPSPTPTSTSTFTPTPTPTATPTTQPSNVTSRVSVASDGTQGNHVSWFPSVSADGRYVAFESNADNLVPSDTNNFEDIFVHDRQTGQTSRISVASDGTQGNGYSAIPAISADGRYVAFSSNADNLVSGDTNGVRDVFVHDRQTGQTSRVSVASDGTQVNNHADSPVAISADGRYVTFESRADNLVPDDTNGFQDVFVHDRQTGQTSRVSVASDGTQGNGLSSGASISSDGSYVAFFSNATNLVPGDTNNDADVFVHDRQTGQTSRVSVTSSGIQGNSGSYWPFISADGRYVAFDSAANNLVPGDTNNIQDMFVHDRQTGQISRVSVASDGTQANDRSYAPSVSADGRYVAFVAEASNLVPGDTNGFPDVFVHDRGGSGGFAISGR
jgi:archaellum component FlaF (FlaF/FlaG flagellin family)